MTRTQTPRATFNCAVCGSPFKRNAAQVRNGSNKCCSKKCLSKYYRGDKNPFWGKSHSEETKKAISESRKGKCLGNQNAKGNHPSDEARAKNALRKAGSCSYCGSTDDFVLDHIIPVFDGGDNWFENCQTLCRPCNLWKIYYIDLPRFKANLARPKGP